MYKCCRWCSNFSDGECKSGAIKTAELNLDTAIMNNLGKVEGVYIDNEHEFVCSEFK